MGELIPDTFPEIEPQPEQAVLGLATEVHPDHPDTNEDRSFALSPQRALLSKETSGYEQNEGFRLTSGIAAAGVFDGMGGYGKGNVAADLLRAFVLDQLISAPMATFADFQSAVNAAWNEYQPNAAALGPAPDTTAVIGWVFEEEGKKHLALASSGDSRAYAIHVNGHLTLLTQDDNLISKEFGRHSGLTRALNAIMDEVESEDEIMERWDAVPQDTKDELQATITPKEDLSMEIATRAKLVNFWRRRNVTAGARGGKPQYALHELAPDVKGVLFTGDGVTDNLTTSGLQRITEQYASQSPMAQPLSEALVAAAKEEFTDLTKPVGREKPDDVTAVVIELL